MIYYNHYTDKLVWTIIKSTFSKKTIGSLIIALLTIVIRIHIDGLLAILLATGLPIVDFLIHITISSVLVIKSQCIYVIVDKFHPEIYQITKYCINNYTPDNLRKWKRMSMLSICLYLFIYFSIVQITSALIRQAILEYIVCYIIIDFYEQGHFTSKIFSRFINKSLTEQTVYDDKILDELIDRAKNNSESSIDEVINEYEYNPSRPDMVTLSSKVVYDDDYDLKF